MLRKRACSAKSKMQTDLHDRSARSRRVRILNWLRRARRNERACVLGMFMVIAGRSTAWAQAGQTSPEVERLVRNASWNEVHSSGPPHFFRYRIAEREARGDIFAQRINEQFNPAVPFLAIDPGGDTPPRLQMPGQGKESLLGNRKMMKDTHTVNQREGVAERKLQQVSLHDMNIFKLARILEGCFHGIGKIHTHNRAGSELRREIDMSSFPATAIQNHLISKIFCLQRRYPGQKLLSVRLGKGRVVRPFIAKSRGGGALFRAQARPDKTRNSAHHWIPFRTPAAGQEAFHNLGALCRLALQAEFLMAMGTDQ